MISFQPTDEQRMMVDGARRFAEEHLRPHFRAWDEANQMPREPLRRGWELGLVAGFVPEAYGGFGEPSALTGALYAEELGWGDLAAAVSLMSPNLAVVPLLLFGTEEQKRRLLPKFCGEEFVPAAAALVEPSIAFDPARLETTASRFDGGFRLSGRKIQVPLADAVSEILVYAREEERTQAFLVPVGSEGLRVGEREKHMGLKALRTYELQLDGVLVSSESKLGWDRGGIRLETLQQHWQVAEAALAVGVSRAAYEYAVHYAKNRVAFGEPIASRQAIAFILAEMAIDIDAARLMVWEAACRLDRGDDAAREACLARRFAEQTALQVTDGAVQVLGGHGYIRDYPVELWLRNGRGFSAWHGLAMV
jgi:alkylation response protein AidB-like acyl-CoA dehydrogenase